MTGIHIEAKSISHRTELQFVFPAVFMISDLGTFLANFATMMAEVSPECHKCTM